MYQSSIQISGCKRRRFGPCELVDEVRHWEGSEWLGPDIHIQVADEDSEDNVDDRWLRGEEAHEVWG